MKTVLLTLALVAAPAFAFAHDRADADRTAYHFQINAARADTPVGAARVYADIRRQAVRVCRPLEQPKGTATKAARACRRDVTAKAVRDAGKPLVTALWREDQETRVAGR